MSEPIPNPYVGPRAFTSADAKLFKGREDDAKSLRALAIAQRTVLFYARSGAGKSSLINTRLIPDLEARTYFRKVGEGEEERNYRAQVVRVGGLWPESFSADDREQINVYIYNLLRHLVPQGSPFPSADDLKSLNLKDLVEKYCEKPQDPVWLVFDQFEEIFTCMSERTCDRKNFFQQLGVLLEPLAPERGSCSLEAPVYSAVFVIRDDYASRLTPFAMYLPNQFRTRTYMDLLKREDALKAIKEPVQVLGFRYAEGAEEAAGAAEELLMRLGKIKTPQGSRESEFIEPVLLQVVCYQLWEKIYEKINNRPDKSITVKDVEEFAKVDKALRSFYDECVKKVANNNRELEDDIRTWFSERLMLPQGIRSQVLREEGGKSGGLDTSIADQFVEMHLIRKENIRDSEWFELSHDRLLAPIRESNNAYSEQYLDKYEKRARKWKSDNFPDYLLLDKYELKEYEEWANQQNYEPDSEVTELLKDSKRAREAAKARELGEKNKRNRNIAIISVGFIFITAGWIVSLYIAKKRLKAAADKEIREDNEGSTAQLPDN